MSAWLTIKKFDVNAKNQQGLLTKQCDLSGMFSQMKRPTFTKLSYH